MDDFPGLLSKDFRIKPQGKSAPMAPPRNPVYGLRSDSTRSNSIFDDDSLYGVPPKYSSESRAAAAQMSSYDYDSFFKDSSKPPVYDDDLFDGLPGVKSSSKGSFSASAADYDNVFGISHKSPNSSPFDDLLGNLGRKETESKPNSERMKVEKDAPIFDDLLSGFGRSTSSVSSRSTLDAGPQKPASNSSKTGSNFMENPFHVQESTSETEDLSSGLFTDPLEEITKLNGSGKSRVSYVNEGLFDDIDPLEGLGKSVPLSSETNKRGADRSHLRTASGSQIPASKVPNDEDFEHYTKKRMPSMDNFPESHQPVFDMPSMSNDFHSSVDQTSRPPPYSNLGSNETSSQVNITSMDNFPESHQPVFDMPSMSNDFHSSVGQTSSPPPYSNLGSNETSSQVNTTSRSEEHFDRSDDVWLTVSEIPLFTQPTNAPPPSRPPPPRPPRVLKSATGSFSSTSAKKVNDFYSFPNSAQYSDSPHLARAAASSSVTSQIDELEDFAMGRTWNNVEEAEVFPGDDFETNSVAAASAAAMKEAMDRAEVKFRHAKGMRERENMKATRNKESGVMDKDERAMQDALDREVREKHERLERERQQREREEEERRELERDREEKEREQRRLEKEREQRRLEKEREQERARQAVQRATREARERAAAEARARAERAAVEKVGAEARERAERAAVQRAQAEARQRAAAEARERAERAAAEAREREAKVGAEARLRAERAAAEKAAAEARERAASSARASQQNNGDDLESFFSMGSRPSSATGPRANSSDPMFDGQNKGGSEVGRGTSVRSSSSMRKASSSANIVDDLSSIFGGAASPSGQFQEVDGESEERRRARLERQQRTQERAAKALAEKNQRDLNIQREQAERHRIGETLDVEIKRWATGKEGNLRALLSTMQYVLWPQCGWQPISLTDLITAAAVKKAYRKATLCIHPDKVQQKGANLQQKYVAEKVFDLLKEAWNKFNSEELF